MQTVHPTLLTRLRNSATDPTIERRPTDLFELYDPDYIPDPVNGFDPADAIETFAAIEITWNGIAYRRSIVSRGNIDKHKGEQTNSVSITFSNIDKYPATLNQTINLEGMWAVVRYVERDITAGSAVLFVGKLDKPGTINNHSFSVNATQEPIDNNAELPLRSYSPEDPEGRHPSSPLFEGIRVQAVAGSFQYPTIIPAQHTIARLFGQRDTIYTTKQWSSLDSTPYGQPIREVLGRAQIELTPFLWADKGTQIAALWSACAGPIQAIENIKTRTQGWSDPVNSFNIPPAPPEIHLGDLGGTGTNAANPLGWPTAGYFSHLAYVSASTIGSTLETEDTPPSVTAIILGRKVPVPNSSGVYPSILVEATLQWTDNPVHLARWVFIATGLDEGFLEDPVNYLTSLHCDQPLLDESNSEKVFIPSADIAQAGGNIIRFRSTGVIDSQQIRFNLGDVVDDPRIAEPGDYEPFNPLGPVIPEPGDPPSIPENFSIVRLYRKRYTFNAPIVERVKATDFLNKVLFPSARLFTRYNSKGRVEIHSEKSADNCLLRSSVLAGVSAIPVDDVTPWKENLLLQGLINIGFSRTTSENRRVTSAVYSADGNAITLSAGVTGTVTATASGANLTGGSTTVPASGTVTIGGSMTGTVTITINGIAVVYALNSLDTTTSVTAMLAVAINADTRLNRYIKATSAGAVLSIYAKYGVLNLSSALANAHTGPRANPTTAPTLAASAGSMAAGEYQVGYAYATAIGKTTISPVASITLSANQKIDVSSITLPAGVVAAYWYVSESPDSDKLLYTETTTGGAFSITDLPSRDNPGIPAYNSTGEESIRIAMPFATNTQGAAVLAQSGLTRGNMNDYNWPLGSEQSSVNQIKFSYRDAKNDFALTPRTVSDRAHYARTKKWKPLEIDLSGVDNWHQAFRLANAALSKNREGDWFNSFNTDTAEAILLEEGDLITASDDSGGLINVVTRIESLSISPTWKVTIRRARKYSTRMFSDDVRQHDIPLPSTLRYVQTRDTLLALIDGPPIRDADGQVPGTYAIDSYDEDIAGDHRGASLYADYGDGDKLLAKFDALGIIGTCTTTLPTATNPGWDRTSTLTVNPYRGTLTSRTEDELRADRLVNLMAVGSEAGGWEYVQFANVLDNGDGTYTLSTFLRGCFGTDDEVRMTHNSGEGFAMMDAAQFIPIQPHRLNQEYDYKAVTTNQDFSAALAVSHTFDGGTARELAPTNLSATRNDAADVLFRFNRQSRLGQALRSFSDVPLAAEREVYQLEVYDGSDVVRTIDVTDKQVRPATLITNHSYSGIGAITSYGYYSAEKLDPENAKIVGTLTQLQTVSQTASIAIATRALDGSFTFHALAQLDPAGGFHASSPGESYTQGVAYAEDTATLVIRIINSRFYFYLNPSENTPPLYVSTYQLTGQELRAYYAAGPDDTVLTDKLLRSRLTEVVYHADEQVKDFGSTQSAIKVRVYQVSATVGRGAYREATI